MVADCAVVEFIFIISRFNSCVFYGLNIIGELIQLYEAKLAHTLNGWPVPKLLP
ncbi:hypothetical protein N474_06315 [Pseudoalteromonas luteoviolacea CPMOR-2]|uniref:Uncharacterized protein n=1 Tax=Pseudoalteromonas luteoviolacea DSM 6061 TaxID=1365250 RepID=A0A166YFK9_9GAMM|nr:hypothetical protein N475_09635 [Pseudoalteromonas luteoviolacea DSM 6061]KZN60006.1 hypothetical protein N474_06315 [Pseudoalteromonas luteoviolacea CPMOR-2]